MGKIVSQVRRQHVGAAHRTSPDVMSLYSAGSCAAAERKYLNHEERQRALSAMSALDARPALFALTLAWSGARVSEVLALTPHSFQIEHSVISIITLKRRRWSVREVPIPPELMQALNREFSLRDDQQSQQASDFRIWPMSRVTAWRIVKGVMMTAGVVGRCACPRGLRHAFGVGTLQAGVPITLLQRWLGHSKLSTTAIYATASGPEERALAKRYWDSSTSRGFRVGD